MKTPDRLIQHGRLGLGQTAHRANEDLERAIELTSGHRSSLRLRNVANPRVDLSHISINRAKQMGSGKSRLTVDSHQQSTSKEGSSAVFTGVGMGASRP
jgi:hypothetical protein